jgi:hypothetical protein
MPNLEAGTIVAALACPNCKNDVELKLNKNGNAYYFCNHSEGAGIPCSQHGRYGRAASQRFQRDYIAKMRKKQGIKTDVQKPVEFVDAANDNSAPIVGGNFLVG